MRTWIVLIVLAAAAVAVMVLLPQRWSGTSSAYNQYLCTTCGLKKSEHIRKLGPLTWSRKVSFENSAVSAAIAKKECAHNWFLSRFGHSSGGLLSRSHADGGCRSMAVRLMLGDAEFARQLSAMPNPSENWALLVAAWESNSRLDENFLEWWFNTEHRSLSEWAATNGYWVPPGTAQAR